MKNIIFIVISLVIGFIAGVHSERYETKQTINDIEQIALEACDVRIKIIKQTCT